MTASTPASFNDGADMGQFGLIERNEDITLVIHAL